MAGPVRLAYSVFGKPAALVHNRSPVVVLHGLLGSGRNWRTLAGRLATDLKRPVYTVDARNHGDSPHTPHMSYDVMSSDVIHFCQSHDLKRIVLIGHSMGGKTAMFTALNHPEIIEKLVVLDVSPRLAPAASETEDLLLSIRNLDISSLNNRREVDAMLRKDIPNSTLRDFLLTNLNSDPTSGRLKWKANLKVIGEYLKNMKGAVPLTNSNEPFNNPTLFIGGEKSNYISSVDVPEINRIFKNAEIKHIPGAGHWLHFEKPNEFIKLVTNFVTD